MQKCIIISIRPEWVEKILNGKKTIEIRKSMPKCDYPIDVYIYCTKGKPYLFEYWFNVDRNILGYETSYCKKQYNTCLNGKIVAKFTLNKFDKYQIYDNYSEYGTWFKYHEYGTWFKNELILLQIKDIKDFYKNSCLNKKDLENYIEIPDIEYYQHNIKTNKNIFYAWHIDNLEIFDKPMELSEFYRNNFDEDKAKPCNCGKSCKYEGYDLQENQSICEIDYDGANCPFLKVSKPPQSWCYAWRKTND